MLNIKWILDGLGLSAIVFNFKPSLGATYIPLVRRLITIKPLGHFC
jgi:hypothetical protein